MLHDNVCVCYVGRNSGAQGRRALVQLPRRRPLEVDARVRSREIVHGARRDRRRNARHNVNLVVVPSIDQHHETCRRAVPT